MYIIFTKLCTFFYNYSVQGGFNMCFVSSTDLKKNLSHYLEISNSEPVYVTKNKKIIAVISNPQDKALADFFSLEGCLKDGIGNLDHEDALLEGIMKKCGY